MSALLHDQQELRAKIMALSAALRQPASSPLQLTAEIMAFGACAQRASDTDMPIPDEVLLALDDDLRRLALSGIVLMLLGTLQQEGA